MANPSEGFLPVGVSGELLDTTLINQKDGTPTHRENILITGVASDGSNTSTTALGSGETFTGEGELNDLPDVMVSCQTDNSGTLYFDFSVDGTNWTRFPVNGFKITAGIHEFHTAVKGPRYFRVELVNDTGAQSYLRLYTYYGAFRQGNSPLNQSVSLDTDAAHVRPSDFQDEIRLGRRSGVTGWNKFGFKSSLTASSGEQMVWPASGNFTPMTSASTFDIAYDGTAGGTTDGAGTTGALAMTIYYIDSSGLPAVALHTLGTDGTDTTSFSGLGINRIAVSSTGTNDTNVSDITVTATGAGTTQAIVPAGTGVTQQALFFTGSNHTAVAPFLWVNVGKPGGGNAKVTVKGYVYNRGVDSRFEVFRALVDTASETTVSINEPVKFQLNATDVLYFVADTDTNAASINVRFSLNEYQLF